MSDTPALGAGTVEVTLGETTLELKPTMRAALIISNMGGGIIGMVQKCQNLDFQAVCSVVQHGAELTPAGAQKANLQERIFAAGIDNVAARAIIFLSALANGGKVKSEDAGDGETDPLAPKPASQ